MNLTRQERAALAALAISSSANGHDFGIIEEVRWTGDRQALGALITQLQKKGLVKVYGAVNVNGDRGNRVTQFILTSEAVGIAAFASFG